MAETAQSADDASVSRVLQRAWRMWVALPPACLMDASTYAPAAAKEHGSLLTVLDHAAQLLYVAREVLRLLGEQRGQQDVDRLLESPTWLRHHHHQAVHQAQQQADAGGCRRGSSSSIRRR